jgi:hypothetical protein
MGLPRAGVMSDGLGKAVRLQGLPRAGIRPSCLRSPAGGNRWRALPPASAAAAAQRVQVLA